ncbi:MAG: hypothetical protein ACYCPP_07830 [Nitrososphaerales archaeon]
MEEYDLIKCIDKALDQFGSSVKNAIFWRMSLLHKSNTSEVVSDPTILSGVIEEIFSDSAPEIEKSIVREIRKVFDLAVEETSSLVVAVNAAKQQVIGTVSKVA